MDVEKKPYQYFRGPEKPQSLEHYLTNVIGEESPTDLIPFGAVYVNHKRNLDPEHLVNVEDVIRVHLKPKRYSLDRGEIRKRVIFENENYVVVNKPANLPMHPTLDNMFENLAHGFDQPMFVTHRLDVPTSGLVLVAKTKSYQIAFNKVIYDRKLKKLYEAIVETPVPNGEITHFMKEAVTAPKTFVKDLPEGEGEGVQWKLCRLIVKSQTPIEIGFKLKIELLTGRTHQIRGQLASLGSPILGDTMYGGKAHNDFGLKSTFISFICPVEKVEKSFELTT